MPSIVRGALFASLLVAAACGGAQRGGEATAWTSAFDAVPVDAGYAYAVDLATLFNSDISLASMLSSVLDAQDVPEMTELIEILEDPTTIGIDADGSLAVFSTTMFPLVVVELSDPDPFDAFLSEKMGELEFTRTDDRTLAGVVFERWTDATEEWFVDVGLHAGHAVVRIGADEENWATVGDDQLAAILTAPRSARWVGTEQYEAMLEALPPNATPTGFSLLQSAPLAPLVEQFARIVEGKNEAEGRHTALKFRDEAHEVRCREAAAEFAAAVPGVYTLQVQYPSDRGVTYHGITELPLAQELATRLRQALTPVSALSDVAFNDATFAVESGVRPFEIMRLVRADADLRDCPTLAAGPALLAYQAELESSDIDEMASLFDGTGLFALFDLDLSAQFPDAQVVASAGSPNPPELSALIESTIRSNGVSPTVDETAAVTTLEYNFFVFVLRVLQLSDRLVFDFGNPPRQAVDVASNSARVGDTFLRAQLDGREIAKLIRDVVDYVNEAGVPATLSTLDAALDAYARILRMDVSARWSTDGIRVESVAEMQQSAP